MVGRDLHDYFYHAFHLRRATQVQQFGTERRYTDAEVATGTEAYKPGEPHTAAEVVGGGSRARYLPCGLVDSFL